MQSGFRHMVWALVATGGLAQGAAQAASFDGQYLKGLFVELGSGAFGNIQLQETPFTWDCTATACTVRDLPTIAVVFGSASGQAVAVESLTEVFSGYTIPKLNVDVIDPLGHHWGVASADAGKWSIGVNIASQTPPAGDPQFATAYGQFGVAAPFYGVQPSWTQGAPTLQFIDDTDVSSFAMGEPGYSESTVLGLKQVGQVNWGPGEQGFSFVSPGAVASEQGPWDWLFQTSVTSANYALPSTTNPRCASLSCMGFKPGTVNVSSFVLNIGVTAVPSPVPEAGSMLMALMGAGLALAMYRRQPR